MEILTANQVLDRYWDGFFPVQLLPIARNMGIEVYEQSNFNEFNISGIATIERGVPEIFLNKEDSIVRKRFTLAHEIGHFSLGHLEGTETIRFRDDSNSFPSSSNDYRETEANRFAAELLMPENMVKNAFLEIPYYSTLDKISDLFNVSTQAMFFRLVNLGLVRNG